MKKDILIINSNGGDKIQKFVNLIVTNISFLTHYKVKIITEREFLGISDKISIDCELCIYLLGKNRFDEIHEIGNITRNSSMKIIFISSCNKDIILGPALYPKASSSIDSAFLSYFNHKYGYIPKYEELISFSSENIDELIQKIHPLKINKLIQKLLDEIINNFSTKNINNLLDYIRVFNQNGETSDIYVFPFLDNIQNNENFDKEFYFVKRNQWLNSKKQIRNRNYFTKKNKFKKDTFSSVGVIGGGTSGYLSALALKKKYPRLKVTLIESSKIPIIGVGEATTPNIISFLFNQLKFDKKDFFRKVKPTCKLGIKFDWGTQNNFYNFPFGGADFLASYLNHGNINNCSISSMLMNIDSSLVIGNNENKVYESLTNYLYHAYHINNKDFVLYLKEKAKELKIELIDDLILECSKDELGNVDMVKGEVSSYHYDFYVDCTGFKSLLLEKVMDSKFVSYSDTLFTNCAVTAKMDNSGVVKPYTHSDTMNNGWCWNTPVRDSDHLGYVFSKNHCSIDEAKEELKLKHPSAEILNIVHFKSGRHEKVLVGNVFAVGNSFAFVEPLESTGIHMIIKEIEYLTDNFNEIKKSKAIREVINNDINNHWDYLKFFLAIHFKYNRRKDTPFWKDCNKIDLKEYNWLIKLYEELGPLSYLDKRTKKMIRKRLPDSLFGLEGIDCILMGQGKFPKSTNRTKLNELLWNKNIKDWERIIDNSIPLKQGNQFV